MHPVHFEGSVEITKPKNMTDEECYSVWAVAGVDINGYAYYMTCWQPSYEDKKAIAEGRPVMVKVLSKQLPPMALFTLDENKNGNF